MDCLSLTSFHLLKLLAFLIFTGIYGELLIKLTTYSSVGNSTCAIRHGNHCYVAIGDHVRLGCFYSKAVKYPSKISCSRFFWKWNGTQVTNSSGRRTNNRCVSLFNVGKVLWHGRKQFHCIYENVHNGVYFTKNKTLTLISGNKPEPVSKPTVQWVEGKVVVTWRPVDPFNNEPLRYTVLYTSPNHSGNNAISSDCGFFKTNNCSQTKVLHCRDSFVVYLGTTYTIRVISENKFGKVMSVDVKIRIPTYPQLTMIKPVSELKVFLTKVALKMKWNDVPSHSKGRKKISYKCEGNEIPQKGYTDDDFYEITPDKLPTFQYCMFCVSRQRYPDGRFSCETCKKARTAEDIPRKTAQLISCQRSSCPSVISENLRNVTVTWRLPTKDHLNGILRQQVIFYRGDNERVLRNISIRNGNVTTWTVQQLKNTEGYTVFIIICTHAGCSSKSNSIYISPIIYELSEFQFFSDKANTGIFIGIILGSLGVCFALIFIVLYLKRHKGERLPPVQEPNTDTVASPLTQPRSDENYDVL